MATPVTTPTTSYSTATLGNSKAMVGMLFI